MDDSIFTLNTIQYDIIFITDLDRSESSKSFSYDILFLNVYIEGVKNCQKVIILSQLSLSKNFPRALTN